MSKPVVITADSTCDLSEELKQRFDIRIVPLTIQLGEKDYLDGVEFTTADIYNRYRADGTLPKTAAPGIQQFTDFFTAILDTGCEIVHLDISSELSGSFNNACIAAAELEGVYTVDSRMLSTGVALLAIEGAECAQRGMSAAAIAEHLRGLTDKVDTSFVLDTLEFMWKGGRCSGVTALGANLLHLKPALEMKDGKLGVYKKYRGNIQSVYRQYIKERLAAAAIRPGHIFITDSGEVPDETIRELMDMVREAVPGAEVHNTKAGCTVTSHCGPKTLGVLFIRE
ncbi:MAG: DegV family protein [Oscillospiraceae bacterium]|nr:DegV family protein [Oscillospiraceae bacterium]